MSHLDHFCLHFVINILRVIKRLNNMLSTIFRTRQVLDSFAILS